MKSLTKAVWAILLLAVATSCGHAPGNDSNAAIDIASQSEGRPQVRDKWQLTAESGSYSIILAPQNGKPEIGVFQVWELELYSLDGVPIFPARIGVSAGMPGHGHGMPTQPQVTRYLGNGKYVVEGLKFNMVGDWEFRIAIQVSTGVESMIIPFNIDY